MLDEVTLRRLYLEESLSIRTIAAQLRIPARKVYNGLMRYRIPRRASGTGTSNLQLGRPPITEATLRQLYLAELRSIRAIAAQLEVSTRTIYNAMIAYRIPRRQAGLRPQRQPPDTIGSIDAERLCYLYERERLSIAAIAAHADCSPTRVRNALRGWGIQLQRRGRRAGRLQRKQAA